MGKDPWTVTYEPRHDKTNKVTVRPAKTQIRMGIRPVWSESSLSARWKLGSLATYWVHSEDSDQPHDKTNNVACAPSEDSDEPGHPLSLISAFAVHMKKAWVLSYPLNAQLRLIWVFAGRTVIVLVLSWGGSYGDCYWQPVVKSESSSPTTSPPLGSSRENQSSGFATR